MVKKFKAQLTVWSRMLKEMEVPEFLRFLKRLMALCFVLGAIFWLTVDILLTMLGVFR